MRQITTVGYERASLDGFLQTLSDASVEVLLDVRAVPVSRKPGFSKTALREALNGCGIRYVGMPALGDPKAGRQAARQGRFGTFRKIYREHLRTEGARQALANIAEMAGKHRCCLLCYERNPETCHRSIVAGLLAFNHKLYIQHLYVEKPDEADEHIRGGSCHLGESRAAAQPTAW